MTRFLQVCNGRYSLLDREDWKFVHQSNLADIDVPGFMWYFADKDTHILRFEGSDDTCVFRKVNVIELNGFSVDFYRFSYKTVTIKLKDREIQLGLNVYNPGWSTAYVGPRRLEGVDYRIKLGDEVKNFHTTLSEPSWVAPNFCRISGLGSCNANNIGMNWFMFGIQQSKYVVKYHGRRLTGTAYALLCGPYAILLDDNFGFDSLALLNGVTPAVLDVDKFVYTVNSYVAKILTLIK